LTNIEYANGLRKLADLYEQNPNMDQPFGDLHIISTRRDKYDATVAALVPDNIEDKGDTLRVRAGAPIPIVVTGMKQYMGYQKVKRMVEREVWERPDTLLEPAQ
jgi:hypothetical protein